MARDLNYVVLKGRVGHDLELKKSKNGKDFCAFTLANNRDYGETQKTNWIRCLAFGKQAEVLGQWVKKGDVLIIEGELSVRSYEKDGQTSSITEVNVNSFHFASSKSEKQDQASSSQSIKKESKPTYTPQSYEEYDPYEAEF